MSISEERQQELNKRFDITIRKATERHNHVLENREKVINSNGLFSKGVPTSSEIIVIMENKKNGLI